MSLAGLIARQSARPQGLLGRLIFGPYLDRANRRINDLVHDALGYRSDSRILEIGFGGGALLLRIAQELETGGIDGVEISGEMRDRVLARARKLGVADRVSLKTGSVEALPFDNACFDRICSVHTLYFWPDLEAGLREIARVCKPGGALVLGFSSQQALIDSGWTAQGFHAYAEDEVRRAYEQAGFTVEPAQRARRDAGGEFIAMRGVRSI